MGRRQGSAGAGLVPGCASLLQGLGVHRREHYDAWPGHAAGAGGVVEGCAGAFLVPVCASLLQGLGVHRREHYDAWPGHAAGAGGVVAGSAFAFLVPERARGLQGLCVWWSWFFSGEGHGVSDDSLVVTMYAQPDILSWSCPRGFTDDCRIIFRGDLRSYGRHDHSVNTGHRMNTTQCAIFPRSSAMCFVQKHQFRGLNDCTAPFNRQELWVVKGSVA